ncbi:MAG: GNAT family N-acetyltransferase [Firmicutes bacterium]|nr:GNAT family N-acetyltransferase [Bacillota bacterium]
MENPYKIKIQFKQLNLEDIHENLLDDFQRYQKITKRWNNGNWEILDYAAVDDWNIAEKSERVKRLYTVLSATNQSEKGYIFGAYANSRLVGFSTILSHKFGSQLQYVKLRSLHVSLDYRHCGIGKKLFKLTIAKAREINAERLYISANSAYETQQFYLQLGCTDATEIDKLTAQQDPLDRQMEYII